MNHGVPAGRLRQDRDRVIERILHPVARDTVLVP
jgi:hypothetical protein